MLWAQWCRMLKIPYNANTTTSASLFLPHCAKQTQFHTSSNSFQCPENELATSTPMPKYQRWHQIKFFWQTQQEKTALAMNRSIYTQPAMFKCNLDIVFVGWFPKHSLNRNVKEILMCWGTSLSCNTALQIISICFSYGKREVTFN